MTNLCSNEVTAYPLGSTGNVMPLSTVTGLAGPWGIAVDADGKTYVANSLCASVSVYAAGSTGRVAAIATISGPDSGLTRPIGIALDNDGNVYVLNANSLVSNGRGQPAVPASIAVYAPGSTGDAKPIATIEGPDTGLDDFWGGIAVDSQGNIYVAHPLKHSVTV